MKFEKNLIKNDSVRVTKARDRQTDGQAQNKRDNVLFASLLIGLSVDFLRWWHVRVVCARVRAIVCVCYCQDAVTKIHKPIFVNIQPS